MNVYWEAFFSGGGTSRDEVVSQATVATKSLEEYAKLAESQKHPSGQAMWAKPNVYVIFYEDYEGNITIRQKYGAPSSSTPVQFRGDISLPGAKSAGGLWLIGGLAVGLWLLFKK